MSDTVKSETQAFGGENPGRIGESRGGGLSLSFRGHEPKVGHGVFLAPTSTVIGDANLGNHVSIWFGSVVRADIAPIEIGDETNIQDHSVIHVADNYPCVIGRRVVVGHRALLHGCAIGDETLIGMGAIVMNGAKIGKGSIVAAGSLVTEGTDIAPGSVAMGSPARAVRAVRPAEYEMTLHLARKYANLAQEYLERLKSGT